MREVTEIATETIEITTETAEGTDTAGTGLLAVIEDQDTLTEERTSDMEGVRETLTPNLHHHQTTEFDQH